MYGTATVISANLLLTAAHNLYDVGRKRRMTHVLCYVGVNGTADRVYATDEFYYP
jgi:V8-like Glu-specific endopeptidase